MKLHQKINGKKVYKIIGRDGETYYLHALPAKPTYYFSKKIGRYAIESKPEGFKVKKNTKSGLPFLFRI